MRTSFAITTIAAALALAACAGKDMRHHPHHPDPRAGTFATCQGNGTCNVDVNFDTGTCELWTTPEAVLVRKTGSGQNRTKLNFHLRNNAFQFPANGIEFERGSPMRCERKADRLFHCENEHRTGTYKYVVRVSGACGGNNAHEKDPFIMND